MNDDKVKFQGVITVTPDALGAQSGHLRCGDSTFRCRLGRSGVLKNKQEGDGATPAGRFALRYLLYRADRISPPKTALKKTPIGKDDGWCDEPTDAFYNRAVTLPYSASAEKMWRDDHQYDVVIVIGHNDDPVVAGGGSAVFIHLLSDDGGPTAGCIALCPNDMAEILTRVGPKTVVEILPE